MKNDEKRQFAEKMGFFSMLGILLICLILWWISFLKHYPEIIF